MSLFFPTDKTNLDKSIDDNYGFKIWFKRIVQAMKAMANKVIRTKTGR